MTDLVQHSVIDKVEMDVTQTDQLNLKDVLCEMLKLLNENTEKLVNEKLKQQNNPKQTVFFTKDLMQMFDVSESTIYNYRKSGKLPYCSDGQKVWFTQENIDAFNWNCDSRNKQSALSKTA